MARVLYLLLHEKEILKWSNAWLKNATQKLIYPKESS